MAKAATSTASEIVGGMRESMMAKRGQRKIPWPISQRCELKINYGARINLAGGPRPGAIAQYHHHDLVGIIVSAVTE